MKLLVTVLALMPVWLSALPFSEWLVHGDTSIMLGVHNPGLLFSSPADRQVYGSFVNEMGVGVTIKSTADIEKWVVTVTAKVDGVAVATTREITAAKPGHGVILNFDFGKVLSPEDVKAVTVTPVMAPRVFLD